MNHFYVAFNDSPAIGGTSLYLNCTLAYLNHQEQEAKAPASAIKIESIYRFSHSSNKCA